ncbi:DNA cytosine methyltransferase [Algivirga pacifica]|uniref:DNA (cytosine-5-)-methyltransferase n=2 Tax=Algivirga pacifica TaxID=1162670 RepID=A0ABP9DN99_9BACT
MAGETFAYNFLKENLRKLAEQGKEASSTFWLNSLHPKNDLSNRLRENPKLAPVNDGHNDLSDLTTIPKDSLVIGNIIHLNNFLEQHPHILEGIRSQCDNNEVDLVSGGPPCQSFSMAGLRQLNNDRNQLPWEFARFVRMVQPRTVILENVSGILKAFNDQGKQFFAWFEVAKAFAEIDYIPICLHINSKYVGVGQSRPRYIMIGIRHDVAQELQAKVTNELEQELLVNSFDLHTSVREAGVENVLYGDLKYYDVEKNKEYFQGTFLAPLLKVKNGQFTSVENAIDDLRGQEVLPSEFVNKINTILGERKNKEVNLNGEIPNHELRRNGLTAKKRFRLYQVVANNSALKRAVNAYLRNPEANPLKEEFVEELLTFDFLNDQEEYVTFKNREGIENYLQGMLTKKQTQKALIATEPAATALSIPDDVCHYHHDQLRTLTVREMARIQSFPDWFEFRSKVTTGGQMRKFEVPQYTQVGNAVPPLLGQALGEIIHNILD